MMAHVDYLSFSFPVPGEFENDLQAKPVVKQSCLDEGGEALDELLRALGKFTVGGTHRPFSAGIRSNVASAALLWNHRLTHGVFELGGTGCELARQVGVLDALIESVESRVVRIDVAIDIATPTTPVEFLQEGWNVRFKSTSLMRSETGETVYVGSRSSARFSRIYRYSEPHPRARLLRVEFELKAEEAKRAAQSIAADGVEAFAAAMVDVFGFKSEELRAAISSPAELPPSERGGGRGETVRWLYTAVAPALAREIVEGRVDPDHFLTYVDNLAREL
jgi:hypothetical protein